MKFARRVWLVPACILTTLFYYVFLWPSDPTKVPFPPDRFDPNLHWTKSPERNPVTSYRDFPEGSLLNIPPIQFDFRTRQEPEEVRSTREKRKAAVKEAFIHAWEGYKKYAWGRDELAPISGIGRSSFGGWGATLVDTMDTLLIMGLKDDFELCMEAVRLIDFTRSEDEFVNVFETTIRFLGGLLSAYDLSEGSHPLLLDKARELGEILYSAFDTPNRMPMTRWQWQKSAVGEPIESGRTTLVAELGSLTLEFTRLSQLTGDMRFFDAVQRISEQMNHAQNVTLMPGLWPTIINTRQMTYDYNHFTMSGMADSTYEYLTKQYMLLGGRDHLYRHMYEEAIEVAKKHLFFRPLVPSNDDILFSGNIALHHLDSKPTVRLEPQGQHLACFIGGMVGIGARIFGQHDELRVAKRLVDGCIWAYNAMPSGLMPETFHMVPCHVGITDPPTGKCDWSLEKWYEGVASRHGTTESKDKEAEIEKGRAFVEARNITAGFAEFGDNRYILRPEAIESVFIMYRITGDQRYQDEAWTMFQSIESLTRTPIAHAALHDVRSKSPEKSDRMESFWLAETLKYFYLIFSDPTLVSLDQWVLNTEAHPFKRPIR